MITEKEALQKTAHTWRWLEEHPDKEKQDYFEQHDIRDIPESACYCCEYDSQAKKDSEDDCVHCPLKALWRTTCYQDGSLYAVWYKVEKSNKNYLKIRSEYAGQIAAAAEAELENCK